MDINMALKILRGSFKRDKRKTSSENLTWFKTSRQAVFKDKN